jgi:hypothetical protein
MGLTMSKQDTKQADVPASVFGSVIDSKWGCMKSRSSARIAPSIRLLVIRGATCSGPLRLPPRSTELLLIKNAGAL